MNLYKLFPVIATLGFGLPLEIAHSFPIYGRDDRTELHDAEGWVSDYARAIPTVLKRSKITLIGSTATLAAETYGTEQGLCADERFADQPSAGICSAFLVAPDLVVTAGHCFNSPSACRDSAFVFDYAYGSRGANPLRQPANNVFGCAKIEYSLQMTEIPESPRGDGVHRVDFAIIRLDREVTDRVPLKMNMDMSRVRTGDAVFMMGHPGGIPLKITPGKVTEDRNAPAGFFKTDLDAFGGNSGSAILSERGEVIGILVRGALDYSYDSNSKCYRAEKLASDADGRESGTSISFLDRVWSRLARGYAPSGMLPPPPGPPTTGPGTAPTHGDPTRSGSPLPDQLTIGVSLVATIGHEEASVAIAGLESSGVRAGRLRCISSSLNLFDLIFEIGGETHYNDFPSENGCLSAFNALSARGTLTLVIKKRFGRFADIIGWH